MTSSLATIYLNKEKDTSMYEVSFSYINNPLLQPQELQLLQLLQLLPHKLQPVHSARLCVALLLLSTNNSSSRKLVLLAKSTSPLSSVGLDSIDNSKIKRTSLLKFIYFPHNIIFLFIMLQNNIL